MCYPLSQDFQLALSRLCFLLTMQRYDGFLNQQCFLCHCVRKQPLLLTHVNELRQSLFYIKSTQSPPIYKVHYVRVKLHYEGEMSAEEKKKLLRESRTFGLRKINYSKYGDF